MGLTARAKTAVWAGALGLTAGAVALTSAAAWREGSKTLKGPEVTVGNGTVRLFVEVGPNRQPRGLGIALRGCAHRPRQTDEHHQPLLR
jgi:hypothetical protein